MCIKEAWKLKTTPILTKLLIDGGQRTVYLLTSWFVLYQIGALLIYVKLQMMFAGLLPKVESLFSLRVSLHASKPKFRLGGSYLMALS